MAKSRKTRPESRAPHRIRRCRPASDRHGARTAGAADRRPPPDFTVADAFIWQPAGRRLVPVPKVNRVEMSLLKGIDQVRDILVENTERFAAGLPANNALLWGARGMGKSSLVKASHAAINASLGKKAGMLKLVEIHREDIESLPDLMTLVRGVDVSASSCSATTFRSTPKTRPTSRSRRCSKAASKAGRKTSSSTRRRTVAI